jgi:hypothetical protein
MVKPLLQIVAILTLLAGLLRMADAVPGWVTGIPRGVVAAATLDEAQSISGISVGLPAPSEFVTTPRGIRASRPPSAGLALTARRPSDGRNLSLYRLSTTDAERLYRPLFPFHEIAIKVAGRPAQLRASRLPDGSVVEEVEWQENSLRTILRFDGSTLELLALAQGLAEVSR